MKDNYKQRAKSQRQQTIKLLRDAGENGVLNARLQLISLNYTARIAELRKLGYVIRAEEIDNGLFMYYLVSEPEQEREQPRAIDIFFDYINTNHAGIVSSAELKELLDDFDFNIVRNWGCNL